MIAKGVARPPISRPHSIHTGIRAGSTALPLRATERTPGRSSYGPDVARVAARLGTPLMPHQALVADVTLESVDGRLAYRSVVLSIMRQSR